MYACMQKNTKLYRRIFHPPEGGTMAVPGHFAMAVPPSGALC